MNIEDLVKDDAADEIARRKDEHAATANFDAGNVLPRRRPRCARR